MRSAIKTSGIYNICLHSYENPADIPKDPKERRSWAMSRKATIELTQ